MPLSRRRWDASAQFCRKAEKGMLMQNTTDKIGICPISSESLLRFALKGLRERGVSALVPEEPIQKEAEKLAGLLPSHYLPDIYLDLPLMGGDSEGMAAVFDCYDRCRIERFSDGQYFRNLNIPSLTAPEDRDILCVLRPDGAHHTLAKRELIPVRDAAKAFPVLRALEDQHIRCRIEPDGRLLFTTGFLDRRRRYTHLPWKEKLHALLRTSGCSEAAIDLLDRASYNSGAPFYDLELGYLEWVVCLDVAAFHLTVIDGRVTDCRAVLHIFDKSLTLAGTEMKPFRAYQWHITDNCDQRCKHCYLFAEDARMKCVTTPWEQLLHTLDDIEADASALYRFASPAVTGGDPLLHPQFWEFAQELHRRGLLWDIMGNPFHLNEDVCRRLYALGCFQYQMSLDGLREYHDKMRKPGSFQATLDAIGLLNNAGIRPTLMATVSRQNMDDLIACMDLAAEHHAASFSFARYCATSPEKAKEAYPSPEEYRDFLLRYYNKRRAYMEQGCRTSFGLKEHLFTLLQLELGKFTIPEHAKDRPEEVYDGCHLGQTVCIAANGDLLACRRMESVIGNVREQSVREITTGQLCRQYADIRNIKKCKDCELLGFCRGCRAVGYNATGDLQCADPMCWK